MDLVRVTTTAFALPFRKSENFNARAHVYSRVFVLFLFSRVYVMALAGGRVQKSVSDWAVLVSYTVPGLGS